MTDRFKRYGLWLSLGIMLVSSALVAAAPVNAQTGDAAATCQAEPRTVDEIIALFTNATPTAAPVSTSSVSIPTGTPASEVLQARITETVDEAFACLNAGEWLRFMGMLTDEAIVSAFPWVGEVLLNGPAPEEFTTPAPLPADLRQTVIAVAEIQSLGSNQAGALVVYIDPASGNPGASALYLGFTRDDDRWLISQVIGFSTL
ncbi:MAG: hypothetical protein IT336_03600 [Thermomicrobiales bacterium]|nr:hypothetical protein [Thermomicrobiales bacterium]